MAVLLSVGVRAQTVEDPSILELPFESLEAPETGVPAATSADPAPPSEDPDKKEQKHLCASNSGTVGEDTTRQKDCPPHGAEADGEMTIKKMFVNLPGDQKAIWTSPFHLRKSDGFWLVPLAATGAGLVGSDQHSMSREQSTLFDVHRSNQVANFGLGAMAAVPAFMYAWGSLQGKSRMRETGLLSGEAFLNALAVSEVMKVGFSRERPTFTDGQGRFFQTPSNASFPSGHATLSWAIASVIAHEYPGPLTKLLVYGGATAISISRVSGRKHFPADVVIGSSTGWLIGRQVFRRHHDKDLDVAMYGTFDRSPGEFDAAKLGSPFVPLDSWVYPALKRLVALGYIHSQAAGTEPWTRRECMRQTTEAENNAQDLPPDSDVRRTIRALSEEFSADDQHYYSAQLESIYTRYTRISGTPLRDSYHYGQTLWNDYGRPYDEGNNFIAGGSARAVAGPFFFYIRGEYQHAPGRPALTAAQRIQIAGSDGNPVQPARPVPATDEFRPLEMYAGLQLGNTAVTFGKQSLWLGPGAMAPLMVSTNPDPMYMLRFTRTTPFVLPSFLKILGKGRYEFVVAKLSGHHFPERPFFNLQKISFQVTDNLQVGMTRASVFWGVGHPATLRSWVRNFKSVSDTPSGAFPNPTDPGDRKSGFEFSYRLPKLRNWLTLYSDYYSDDEPLPLYDPRRSAPGPGLYLSHFPKIPKLDLRVEAASTQAVGVSELGPRHKYYNNQYHDANTNRGYLFGNAVGRDGRAYQAWSTYHFSAQTDLQFSYRQVKVSTGFLPGGGTQNDASVRFRWQARPEWSVDAFVQYERWLLPILEPTAQRNVTGQVQVTYRPRWRIHQN